MNFRQVAAYRDKLKDPRWQRKRLEIMNRDDFKCKYCGDEETSLQIHHLSYSGDPWEVDNDQLVTLCEDCHSFVEYCKTNKINLVLPYQKVNHKGDPPSFLMRFYNIMENEKRVGFYSSWNGKTFLSAYSLKIEFFDVGLSIFDVPTDYDEEVPF